MFKKQSIIPAVLWGFFILYLTIKPKSANDFHSPIWLKDFHPDKIAHFGFWALWYAIYHLTYLKQFQISTQTKVKSKQQRIFIVIAILFGATIEILQFTLKWGRSADWLDLIADSSGVFSAFLYFKWRNKG